jgi:hypothetical protein
MLRRVGLVITDVSEEPGASELSVITRATRRNIPEDTILLYREIVLVWHADKEFLEQRWKLCYKKPVYWDV